MAVIMSRFCSYCSTRLGAVVIGILSLIQGIIPLIVITAVGAESLQKCAYDMRLQTNDEMVVDMVREYVEKDADTFVLTTAILLVFYITTCVLEIFAAIKLAKIFLLPYIGLELIRLIILFVVHIFLMIALKKQLNLGSLIATTVAGGFGLLLLCYMWTCVVSLFQILVTVNTPEYKSLYGHLPLTGKIDDKSKSSKHNYVENVQMYPVPEASYFNPAKNNNVSMIEKTIPKRVFDPKFEYKRSNLVSRY